MSGKSPIKLLNCILSLLGMMLSVVGSGFAQTNVTPAQYLAAQPKPKFKPDHTLPALTYTGWGTEPTNVVSELAQHWGYAVETIGVTPYANRQMTTEGSRHYVLTQLVLSDTNRYQAAVHCIKHYGIAEYLPPAYTNLFDPETKSLWSKASFLTNSAGEYLDGQGVASPYYGYRVVAGVTNNHYPAFSYHSPNADWQRVTDAQTELLRMFRSNCPIAVIIDDGEWGPAPYSSIWRGLHKDPGFVAAMAGRGVTLVPDVYAVNFEVLLYTSEQAGRMLSFFPRSFATNFPEAKFYYYQAGLEKYRIAGQRSGQFVTTNYNNGSAFDSRFLLTNWVMPSVESYYRSLNSGLTNGYNMAGLDIANTGMPLQHENWVGNMIKYGYPLSYNYVTAGWDRGWLGADSYMSDAHYIGWLKCMYTMGSLGVNAGWYGDSKISGSFPAPQPPQWLTQKIIAGRVHAQFSWLEDYLRNGALVAGPYTNLMSSDNMSYDFNQGKNGANNAHVYVRKHNDRDNWIICAWSADATNSSVTITVPGLGKVTVNARTNGSVYLAAASSIRLVDPDGTFPTEFKPTPPSNLETLPPPP